MMKLLLLFTLLFLPSLALANLCETKAFATRSAGSQVVDMANRFLSKIGISKQLKPNGEGKDFPSAYIRDPSIVGIETYSSALLRETKLLLQREITPQEAEAIEKANSLKTNAEEAQTSATNLRAKVQILKNTGFSKAEIRKLMESGLVWTRNLSSQEALLKNLQEGKEDIYFSPPGPFPQPSRIHKVVQETSKYFEVLAEVVTDYGVLSMDTVRIRKNLIGDDINTTMLHPNTQVLFSVSRSKKPKIRREDIKLPPPTREEAKLKEQGFGPAWTKGLDKLNEWVALRRQLQELKANPRTTHIPYFADQIPAHLAFAKEGLGTAPISRQKEIGLADLVREAQKAIVEERVTYEWWLKFNFQISALFSVSDHLPGFYLKTSSPSQASFISRFPLEMAVPTIYGEIGIITLNRAQNEGIYPLGLISQAKEVDGELRSPYEFVKHDMAHANIGVVLLSWRYSLGHILKHKEMLDLMDNSPIEKRKQAELVYFSLTHEYARLRDIFFENQPREKMLNQTAKHFNNLLDLKVFSLEMAGLGKEYVAQSKEDRIQYIREHVVEPFMQEVYDPVF